MDTGRVLRNGLNLGSEKQGVWGYATLKTSLTEGTLLHVSSASRWSIAVTNAPRRFRRPVRASASRPCSGLPYDGHTLKDQIAQVEAPHRRERGPRLRRPAKAIAATWLAAPEIHFTQSPGQRSPTVKRELRRRAAVEPIIGHAKSDGLLERNRFAGARRDAINAVLVGAGHNIRLLLAWLTVLLRLMLAVLTAEIKAHASPQSEPTRSSEQNRVFRGRLAGDLPPVVERPVEHLPRQDGGEVHANSADRAKRFDRSACGVVLRFQRLLANRVEYADHF